MALDTEVPPFGATAAGAAALVPEARLVAGSGPAPEGTYGITEAQVEAWVGELTAAVAMRLTGWQRLSAEVVEPETTSDRDQLIGTAAGLIHNGAGSYLEAARHPERSGVNDDSYSAVLWNRYTTGLDALAGWLEGRLYEGDPGDEPAGAPTGIPIGYFPEPLFGDALRF